jgi:hypothetical protein
MTARWKRQEHPGGRTRSLRIRLAESERDELFGRAAAQGVSVARYVLTIVFTGESPRERADMRGELLTIRRTLVGLGVNVNQATKVAHMTGDARHVERMADQVDAALRRLDVVLGGLR